MGDEFRTDNAMEACRRTGLRCEDCLPRRSQWCDLCDYRQQVVDAMIRRFENDDQPEPGTVWILAGYDNEFLAAFATREAAEEGRRLHIEADRQRCAASPMETVRDTPWTPPDTAVFMAPVHVWPRRGLDRSQRRAAMSDVAGSEPRQWASLLAEAAEVDSLLKRHGVTHPDAFLADVADLIDAWRETADGLAHPQNNADVVADRVQSTPRRDMATRREGHEGQPMTRVEAPTSRVLLVWHRDDSLLGIYADNPTGRAAAEALVASERAENADGQTEFLARLRAEGRLELAALIEQRGLDPEGIRIEVVDVLHSDGEMP